MVKLDDLILDFVSASPKTENKSKDFDMNNGDIIRYTIRRNLLSLSCKGLIDKSELDTLLSMTNEKSEFNVQYQLNGIQAAVMLIDSLSFKKLMMNDVQEYWEISFNLKESKR